MKLNYLDVPCATPNFCELWPLHFVLECCLSKVASYEHPLNSSLSIVVNRLTNQTDSPQPDSRLLFKLLCAVHSRIGLSQAEHNTEGSNKARIVSVRKKTKRFKRTVFMDLIIPLFGYWHT